MSLSSRDKKVIWHPYTQMKTAADSIAIVKGEGVYLYDEYGNKYIDAVSSWWVNIHGHSHPYIAKKVAEQACNLEHVIFAGFTHEPAIELAERLLPLLPCNQSKIFYSDDGSTAVEVAIKMALQYWSNQGINKTKILAFEHSYHGDTFGSMSVSARSSFTAPFNDFLFDVIHLPLPTKGKEMNTIAILDNLLDNHLDSFAAFIFEPLILGAGGMLMVEPEVLDVLINKCQDAGIITIADEVMTGFGRTGKLFACNHLSNHPDIFCLSKGITGGTMALGVTSCNEKIHDAFLSDDKAKTLFHGHSFTANPIACAAANASLDLLLNDTTQSNMIHINKQQLMFMDRMKGHAALEDCRCIGTILAMDIRTSEKTSYFNSLRDEMYSYFLNKGILLRPLGNTLYIMPPYCITDEELQYIHDCIFAFCDDLIDNK